MAQETNAIVQYQGNQINLYYDDKNDFVSLTDIYKAWNRYSKSINAWLKTKQTLEFLAVWEKKHNPKFKATHLSQAIQLARERNGLSADAWIKLTDAIGIFTRSGEKGGTYAHKDIAIRFAGWLSPDFELHLVEEIQRLKKLEQQKNSFELLNHEEILALVRLKEVFKYVAHQEAAEKAHRDVHASKSSSGNPFAEFNKWRNEILDISKQKIDERIKKYCEDNKIAATSKLMNLDKKKILLLDSYESVRNAVWDFLEMKGEINALNLANLAGNMIRIEQGQVMRHNEDNLFDKKQDLGQYTDFHKQIDEAPEVKTAREILDWRDREIKKLQSQAVPFGEIIKRIAKAGKPSDPAQIGAK